jgi:hypothetical protein
MSYEKVAAEDQDRERQGADADRFGPRQRVPRRRSTVTCDVVHPSSSGYSARPARVAAFRIGPAGVDGAVCIGALQMKPTGPDLIAEDDARDAAPSPKIDFTTGIGAFAPVYDGSEERQRYER